LSEAKSRPIASGIGGGRKLQPGSRYFQQGWVDNLQGWQYFQQGRVNLQLGSRNTQPGGTELQQAAPYDRCICTSQPQRGDILVAGGEAPDKQATHIPAPLFSAPTLATGQMQTQTMQTPTGLPTLSGLPEHENTVFYIPTSFSYRPSGAQGRTRNSMGAGGIRACLPPFTFFLINN
jgi:hypothetical protein